jgi:hypothetical protein
MISRTQAATGSASMTPSTLSLRERKFALGLEQAPFDRNGTAKSPQEVC